MARPPLLLCLLALAALTGCGGPVDPDGTTTAVTCTVAATAAYVEAVRTCLRPVTGTDTGGAP